MRYLRSLTGEERAARRCQVVVATHSPYLLDFVDRSEVVVFGRRDDGASVAVPLQQLRGVNERLEAGYTLGELWYTAGENELLRDVLAGSPAP